jgi:hypothetical protein
MKRGIADMLTIIKASLMGSALMLLASCTGYLTNYQTPCVQGHVCECVQYTTDEAERECRDYGPDKVRSRFQRYQISWSRTGSFASAADNKTNAPCTNSSQVRR